MLGMQALADCLIMLSGTERGENTRILCHAHLHLRYYRHIGDPSANGGRGEVAVCWVQNEGKGNQVLWPSDYPCIQYRICC